jgi:hypothetical protein
MDDELLAMLDEINDRIGVLESAPPGQWAQSVAFLLREFVTTKTVTTAVSVLTGLILFIYSMVNGVPTP